MQGTSTRQRARSALCALTLIGFVLVPVGCSSPSAARVGGSSGNLNVLGPHAGAFQNESQQRGGNRSEPRGVQPDRQHRFVLPEEAPRRVRALRGHASHQAAAESSPAP